MPTPAQFIFATCQHGAEAALKHEILRDSPQLRFAYSRPGFVTFKQADNSPFADDFQVRSVFARVLGVSLGRCSLADPGEFPAQFWNVFADRPIESLHVFPRDLREPGHRGYEPGPSPESVQLEERLRSAPECPPALASASPATSSSTSPGDAPPALRAPDPIHGPWVADAILVEPHEVWAGCHRARRPISAWPGGFLPPPPLPERVVSRVFFKMTEALVWAGFPLVPQETVVEIGCSPGGASQVLLDRGLHVIGIDPAAVDPLVANHPNFRHIRQRSKDVSRREFRGVDWLTCDINLPPGYTLDTVESIVSHPRVTIRGLILTLKLIEWELASEIPSYVERVRGWGYKQVRVRQLHHNRQEVCLVAR